MSEKNEKREIVEEKKQHFNFIFIYKYNTTT